LDNVKLGDIATLKTGPFGTQFSASEYVECGGIPMINVKDIGYGEIIDKGLERISERTANRLKQHVVQEGDLVYGRKGSIDRHAYISKEQDGWIQGSDCIRIRVVNGVNARFLSYYLMLPSIRTQVMNMGTGSTMPSLNTDILSDIDIRLPNREIQNKAANILALLDAKIANNKKLMAELEATARLIYDYWFMQFDFPDVNGKPYRSSGGKMAWSDALKCEVPAGWYGGRMSDLAVITMGQSPSGDSYNEDCIGDVFYQGRVDFGDYYPKVRMYTTAATRFAAQDDVLLSVRAPVGDTNFAYEDCCIGRGLAALRSKAGSPLHLRFTLKRFDDYFERMNGNGTTFGSIDKEGLNGLKVSVPPESLIREYEARVGRCYETMRTLECEVRQLTSLRDWLLPMLMNGQAQVSE
jgi:type I restriction enzyme S subunit